MSGSVPYIGSKISLISNSEIRYEGILYTINTQESTIALQSVRCFGTESRKTPEIPSSSEVYDFIIFRGQDIKDLTVLESRSAVSDDPAVVSVNQKPPGKGKGKEGGHFSEKGGCGGKGKGSGSYGGGYGRGYGAGYGGWGAVSGQGGKGATGGKGDLKGGKKGGDLGKGGGKGEKGSFKGMKGSGKDAGKSSGKDFGGKGGMKGSAMGGKDAGGSKGGLAAGKRAGGAASGSGLGASFGGASRSGGAVSGVPVGELQPEENAEVKKNVAEDFDVNAANDKFAKLSTVDGVEGFEDRLKPLPGYNKATSFFDSISCEATERPADFERPKVDREKAREFDKETFGDTRRPPRPAGGRPGKGRRRGAGSGKGYHG